MQFFSASKVIKQMGFCGISPDVFHINKRHGLLEECVESSRKKQKREHIISPGRSSQKQRQRVLKQYEFMLEQSFLVGTKLIALEKYCEWKRQLVVEVLMSHSRCFCRGLEVMISSRERRLIEYQWEGAKEKKQVSGFMAQGKEIKKLIFLVIISLDMEATSSSLCRMSQVIGAFVLYFKTHEKSQELEIKFGSTAGGSHSRM
ncbi:hypothetical protein Bca4012_023127 [Brassica carinata]|uniref:Uncharacterized protein n=1 Tax=Brassica carinata TaxID=52824 RepID=A0A8X7W704_BRACI|nr:hypothetical protein Bca52824_016416 [Brassica carinata]